MVAFPTTFHSGIGSLQMALPSLYFVDDSSIMKGALLC